MTRSPWRPQLRWLPMGALLGVLSGALVGAVLMAAIGLTDRGAAVGTVGELAGFLALGTILGGLVGVAVGLVVGLALTFLVGSHLPREVARARARAWGHVLPPLVVLIPSLASGSIDPGSVDTAAAWWLLVPVGASVLGGAGARWVAGLGRVRPTGVG